MEQKACLKGLPAAQPVLAQEDQEKVAQTDKGTFGGPRCTKGGMERRFHVRQSDNRTELQSVQPNGRLQQGGTVHEGQLLHAWGTGWWNT